MTNTNKMLFRERTISGFGVSIGTDLMLESLFEPTMKRYDESREIPNKLDVNRYKYHIYNVYTLLRNIVGAVKYKNKIELYTMRELYETLEEEINVLDQLYEGTKCTPVMFIPDYDRVIKHMNAGKSKVPRSVIEYNFYKTNIPRYLKGFSVLKTYKLEPVSEDVLITTAYANDLLNVNYIRKLKLLESHTGKLKGKTEWNTKYNKMGKKYLGILPFNEKLLYIFGDGKLVGHHELFIRRGIYEIALKKKWNAMTSYEKILFDLKGTEYYDIVKNYKRIY